MACGAVCGVSVRRAFSGLFAAFLLALPGSSAEPPSVRSDADLDALLPRLSNWGRWGAGDQLGTLNHLTPARVKAARALVRSGLSVSLARKVSLGENPGIRRSQHELQKDEGGSRDYVGAIWHGFAQTHLDALCHGFANPGQMYGGIPTAEVTVSGCRRLGIDAMAERGIVGRGVLLDLAAVRGGPLAPGTAILPRDLEAAARRQRVELRPGDLLAVRTGAGPRNTREQRAGLHPACLAWLKDRDVAVLLSDGDSDVQPLPGFERWQSPIHSIGIPYLGLALVDNAELDALAATAERLRRWEFLLVIAPWRVEGATSSPVNPLAVF